jgi:hypothetical protein
MGFDWLRNFCGRGRDPAQFRGSAGFGDAFNDNGFRNGARR